MCARSVIPCSEYVGFLPKKIAAYITHDCVHLK